MDGGKASGQGLKVWCSEGLRPIRITVVVPLACAWRLKVIHALIKVYCRFIHKEIDGVKPKRQMCYIRSQPY